MIDEEDKLDTKAIWLLLLKEGGWWSPTEVAKELGGDYDVACRTMNQMHKTGHVKRRDQIGRHVGYAVDRACKVPRFVYLYDLMDAGVAV